MTLRGRLAVLTAAAVAFAIVAASVAAWLLIRSSLMGEVDLRLREQAQGAERIADMTVQSPRGGRGTTGDVRLALRTDPIGVQLVDPDGTVRHRIAPGEIDIAVDPHERGILEGDADGEHVRTVAIDGSSYRVMSTTVAGGRLLRLIQPLDRVEATLSRIAWLLAAIAGAGVAAAGALGWVTARAGLRPVDRLVAAAEEVAATKDLAHRIAVTGGAHDEVARLAASLNAMLAGLEGARAQQRELVENAGHELRTPLATLRNDLGLLVSAEQHPERPLAPADRERVLRDLEAEAEALSALVEEVVDLARGEVEPEPLLETDLRAVIDRAVDRAVRADRKVAATVRGARVEAAVRPVALERALTNLVRNAVQVSPEGGTVEIELADEAGWATLRVLDRGPGIGEADLPRVFARFYRGEGSRERHGSGLGLAIVAQVAELHGGRVEADNRPGGGAVFTLRLPVGHPATGTLSALISAP
jgi:two-component system, OmpR family, sensor histidine kinase MprB